jgi:hypothetical protein
MAFAGDTIPPRRAGSRFVTSRETTLNPIDVLLAVCGWVIVLSVPVAAAELKPQTVAAFDRYVRLTEARMDGELRDARRRALDARLRRGELIIEKLNTLDGGKRIDVPDGMIHHWVGTVFIPDASVDRAVALLQDYDRHAEIYRPAVVRSKTLERRGDHFRVYLRFFLKKVIAVTMDTEHEADFVRLDERRTSSRIRSTRNVEVDDAGTPRERQKPAGRDSGFLWRLNTYWRFLQADGGTYVECESITLSRDIPFGLGWLIGPFVTSVPKDSLTFTLEATRKALSSNAAR